MATTTTNKTARRAGTTRKTGTTTRRRSTASTTTSTQPTTGVEQVQQLAERAILVPVGAGLIVRDSLVSNVRGLTSKYSNTLTTRVEKLVSEAQGLLSSVA